MQKRHSEQGESRFDMLILVDLEKKHSELLNVTLGTPLRWLTFVDESTLVG